MFEQVILLLVAAQITFNIAVVVWLVRQNNLMGRVINLVRRQD